MPSYIRLAAAVLAAVILAPRPSCAGDAATQHASSAAEPKAAPPLHWQTDYAQATRDAQRQGKMLLLFFFDPADEACRRFEADALGAAAVSARLKKDYVCARLPLRAQVGSPGGAITVLQHAAFAEMQGRPGVAIVDYAQADPKRQGDVISAFPLTATLSYTAEQLGVILDLPPGTLTQRTLIYAVRVHPEHPASTAGTLEPNLVREAEGHSAFQARIRLQGHHNFATRFDRISALLPPGLAVREVCAESWPGQGLVEAAIECVRCWRCSSGHWEAVRGRQQVYGYDMKLGDNGIWYATGIFGGG